MTKVGFNIDKIVELFGDKIYNSDGSAFREQIMNAVSHGVLAYHMKYGYDDNVFVEVIIDHAHKRVTVTDNGMGMSKEKFYNFFASFGTTDNSDGGKRSGQHGLGAMSFLRLSSSTIVESKTRDGTDHYCALIEDGKDITEHTNRTLTDCGTRIEMTLKNRIRIDELRETVKAIGDRSPVRIKLVELNTEVSQTTNDATIRDYGLDGEDISAVKIFEAKRSFDDVVNSIDTQSGTRSIRLETEDPDVECILCDTPSSNSVSLCRVPIQLNIDYGIHDNDLVDHGSMAVFRTMQGRFGVWVNILDEQKFRPEHHRDSLDGEASSVVSSIVGRALEKFLKTITLQDPKDIVNHEYKWILYHSPGDELLNDTTVNSLHQLRMRIDYRIDDKTGKGALNKDRQLIDIIPHLGEIFFQSSLSRASWITLDSSGIFDEPVLVRAHKSDRDDELIEILELETYAQAKKRLKLKSNGKRISNDAVFTAHTINGSVSVKPEDIPKLTRKNLLFNEYQQWDYHTVKDYQDWTWWKWFSDTENRGQEHIMVSVSSAGEKKMAKFGKDNKNLMSYWKRYSKQKTFKYSIPDDNEIHTIKEGKIEDIIKDTNHSLDDIKVYPSHQIDTWSKFHDRSVHIYADRKDFEIMHWCGKFNTHYRDYELKNTYDYSYENIGVDGAYILKHITTREKKWTVFAIAICNLLYRVSSIRRGETHEHQKYELLGDIAIQMVQYYSGLNEVELDQMSSIEAFAEKLQSTIKTTFMGSGFDLDDVFDMRYIFESEDGFKDSMVPKVQDFLTSFKTREHRHADILKDSGFVGLVETEDGLFAYVESLDLMNAPSHQDLSIRTNWHAKQIDDKLVLGVIVHELK